MAPESHTRRKLAYWIEGYVRKRCPELERPLLEAIDAFDRVQHEPRLDSASLAPIVAAVSSSREPLNGSGSDLLGKLAVRFPEARNAIQALSSDARSHVRFNAVLCLCKPAPKAFCIGLLRSSLVDKSSRVRTIAATTAWRLRAVELVPDLEVALSKERSAKAKGEIEFVLRLLRDGYILKAEQGGSFRLTAPARNGFGSRTVKKSELKRRGLHAIVAEMASV